MESLRLTRTLAATTVAAGLVIAGLTSCASVHNMTQSSSGGGPQLACPAGVTATTSASVVDLRRMNGKTVTLRVGDTVDVTNSPDTTVSPSPSFEPPTTSDPKVLCEAAKTPSGQTFVAARPGQAVLGAQVLTCAGCDHYALGVTITVAAGQS